MGGCQTDCKQECSDSKYIYIKLNPHTLSWGFAIFLLLFFYYKIGL